MNKNKYNKPRLKSKKLKSFFLNSFNFEVDLLSACINCGGGLGSCHTSNHGGINPVCVR